MKSHGLCNVKGCPDSPSYYPVVVLVATDGSSVPAIVGLKICRKHKRATHEVSEVLADGGDALVEAFRGAGATIVQRRLAWTPIDGPEGKAFARMQQERPS